MHLHKSGFTLVLGGGGARGLAHIGVLRALESEGLIPDMLVGTSMGAIIGGMYAQNPNAGAVEERVRALTESNSFMRIGLEAFSQDGAPDDIGTVASLYSKMRRGYGFLKSAWSTGIVDAPILLKFLSRLLDDRPIRHCRIPFAAVCCDLMTGAEVICRSGSIVRAVAASSAIPGVVAPVKIDGRLLVDGGPTSMVPVDAAHRLSRLPVVAVTVTRVVEGTKRVSNAIDVVLRAGAIARMQLSEYNLRDADVVIRPDVASYGWAEFPLLDAFVVEGERAARRSVRHIRKVVQAG